jgi:nucleotide-binding universal stress UspA family protein
MFDRIVIAYDDSAGSRRALEIGLRLVRATRRGELVLVAVAEHLPRYGATIGEVDEERAFEGRHCQIWLATAEAHAAEHGIPVRTEAREGHAAQQLVQAAQTWAADLIILGHSGHSAVWGRFLGSTVEKVSRHAPCSVLIAAPAPGRDLEVMEL